ncbi:MAG: DNA polymerase I [Chloroflexi bacterium]|nr:DNA polymerase I [Chloroflexota bacterium]
MSRDKPHLMLIDGHALAYRAYHAIPALSSPTGEPTNATFGYANMLLKAIQDYAPDYVIATFDAGRTFRHEAYADYKATRAETPDDLRTQFDRITQLTEALGIPIYTVPGYEADDLLGTLSAQAASQGLETIIVTGDTDAFQLISDSVKVLTSQGRSGQAVLYDLAAIQERYGLKPEQLIDLKALTGDSSDNIPGVKGVGDKTGQSLLREYGSLESIYEHLDQVSQTRFREALAAGRENAGMSKRLATIVRDVDVALDLESSRWGSFDRERVMSLLRELGFFSLVSRIPESGKAQPEQLGLFGAAEVSAEKGPSEADYAVVDSAAALAALAARLRQAERIAIDTETTSTDPLRAALVGISLSDRSGRAYYLPVGHDQRLARGRQLTLDQVRDELGPILADGRILKVLHNAKFDMMVLAQQGMPVCGECHDSMIAAWLLSPSGRGIGLKEQAFQRLGVEMTSIQDLLGAGRNQLTMDKVSIPKVAPYACADADMTLRLMDALRPELEQCEQWELFANMEMPLVPVLISMEQRGMAIDANYLARMSKELAEQLGALEERIYKEAGRRFNIGSTKQLGVVLFDELGLPALKRTRTGYSTDVSVLEELKKEHPIAALVLEHRQLDKLKSTYIDALPLLINPQTGRVHTSFNQTGTSTGRLSSSDPNLQNIPVRTELGRKVRAAFVAPPGHMLLACDYSQVELRLLAHLSQDPEMLAAFRRNEDVHATTAAAIFGVPLAEVSYEQRSLAKAINFGLMYGMSDYGLSSRTDLSVSEARQFIEAYFDRFKQVKRYLDETIQGAHQRGYVSTILGRRRYFPELKASRSASDTLQRAAERAAVNMPIQGSAADIIKLAMIALHRRLEELGLASRMVLQVHDELVLEVPESELAATRDLVVETMENAYRLDAPLKVDVGVGRNWMEIK